MKKKTKSFASALRIRARAAMVLIAMLVATTGAWADGTVYTTAVALDNLQVGDILADGFSLTIGTKSLLMKGYKSGETTQTAEYDGISGDLSFQGVTITATTGKGSFSRTPYVGDHDGNAWIVSQTDAYFVYIDGYDYATGPTILTLAANPANGGTVELADAQDGGYSIYVNGQKKATVTQLPYSGITAETLNHQATDVAETYEFPDATWENGTLTINGPTSGKIIFYDMEYQVTCLKNRPTLPIGVSWYTETGNDTFVGVEMQGFMGNFFQWHGSSVNGFDNAMVNEWYPVSIGPRDGAEEAYITSVELTSDGDFDELMVVYPENVTRSVSGNVLTISGLPEGTTAIDLQKEGSGEFIITGIKVNYETAPIEGKYVVTPGTQVNVKATAGGRYGFGSWTNATAGTPNTTASVTVNEDVTVTANFIQNPVVTFAVSPEKSGSVVLADMTIDENATLIATKSAKNTYAADGVTVTVANPGDTNYGAFITSYDPMTIATDDGSNITSLVLEIGDADWNAADMMASAGTCTVIENTNLVTVTGINAPSVQITNDNMIFIASVEVNHMATTYPAGVLPALGTVTKSDALSESQYGILGEFFTAGDNVFITSSSSSVTIKRKDDAPADVYMTGLEFSVDYGDANDAAVSVGTKSVSGSKVTVDNLPANTTSVTITTTGDAINLAEIKVFYPGTTVLKNAYSVAPGTSVKLKAKHAKRYHFKNWGTGVTVDGTDATKATVTVGTENVTATANFEKDPVLTFTPAIDGSGTVELVGEQDGVAPELAETSETLNGDNSYSGTDVTWAGNIAGYNNNPYINNNSSGTISVNDESSVITSVEITSDDNLGDVKTSVGTASVSGNVLTIADLPEGTTEIVLSADIWYDLSISQIKVNYEAAVPNVFCVAPNTTANFQAVPGDIYHFKQWGDGATADTQDATKASVAMGTQAKSVGVTFALNPVLTLTPEGDGTLAIQGNEITIADALTDGSVIVANLKTSTDIDYGATFTNNNGTFTASNGIGDWNYSALHITSQGNTLMLYCSHGNGNYNATIAINIDEGTYSVTGGQYRGTLVSLTVNGTTLPVANGTIVPGSVMPAGVVEKDADAGLYYVRPNTDLTVAATPAAGNYMQKWNVDNGDDEVVNGFNATKDFTMGTEAKSVKATFNACPVLTLAVNDTQMGSVEIPITTGGVTAAALTSCAGSYVTPADLPSNFVPITLEQAQTWSKGSVICLIYGIDPNDNTKLLIARYSGGVYQGEWTEQVNSMYLGFDAVYYATGYKAPGLPAGVTEKAAGQYYVFPGTEVTVKATPATDYLLESWSNSTAVNAQCTNTFTVNTDMTLTATFGLAGLTLAENVDNSATITEKAGHKFNVTLTRTLQTGGWNTFSVPFDTDTPSGWTVKELTNASYDDGTKTLSLEFGDASSIEAGKPYMVKVGDVNVVNPTFNDVTIVDGTTPTTITDIVEFLPAINPTALPTNDKSYLFVSGGNKLTWASSGSTMNGFRAYFHILDNNIVNARAFTMSFGDDDEATGIISIHNAQRTMHNDVYDLQGRKINGQSSMVNGQLKKGVYIMNGKKVVVK